MSTWFNHDGVVLMVVVAITFSGAWNLTLSCNIVIDNVVVQVFIDGKICICN